MELAYISGLDPEALKSVQDRGLPDAPIWDHRIASQFAALSRLKRGCEPRWSHHFVPV